MRKINKGDRVIVISGEDRGKEGVILKINSPANRAIVGGIVDKEAPVDFSNLLVICGKCNTGVKTKIVRLSDGSKVRACKKCGEMITVPK